MEPATQWPRESRVELAGWCIGGTEALVRAQSLLPHLRHDGRQPQLLHTRRGQARHRERERRNTGKEPKRRESELFRVVLIKGNSQAGPCNCRLPAPPVTSVK